jgi:predicted acetyltransferase
MQQKKLKLVLPSKKYLKSYQNFCRDFIKNGTTEEYRKGYEKQLASTKKPLFLKWLHDDSKGINLEKGMVQMTTYWAIVNGKVVGRINVRHKLNKQLREYGGHIGYAVRPTEQKKRYATIIKS